MAIENTYKDFQSQMDKMTGNKKKANQLLDFDSASERMKQAIMPEMGKYLDKSGKDDSKDKPMKKSDLKTEKKIYKTMLENVYYKDNFSVVGYDKSDDFIDDMVEEIIGYSVLAQAFHDPDVDDIFCLQWDKIYIEKNGVNEVYTYNNRFVEALVVDEEGNPIYLENEYGKLEVDDFGNPIQLTETIPEPVTFRSEKHYKDFIARILGKTGKDVNNGNHKIVDAEFYEDRICITGKSISPIDLSMTIRKHREEHITLDEIREAGVVNEDIQDLLGLLIAGESNIIYAGITGSGKTTSIRAFLDYYVSRLNKRMIVAEDTQELFPTNPHTLQLVTSVTSDATTTVDLRDLVMTALRLKPKYIVIGEVRGKEAEAAVEAMETGHSTIFTMHGGNPWNIVNRLVNKYLSQMPSLSIEVVERIIGSSVDYICIQDAIPGIGRRVTSVTEVTYDFESGRVILIPIYEFDFSVNDFAHINNISPVKANKMMRRGVSFETLSKITRPSEEEYFKDLNASKKERTRKSVNEYPVASQVEKSNHELDEDDEYL